MKTFLVIIILSLCISNSFAQSFDFYGIAGPVVSQIDGDRIGGFNKAGLMFGVGIQHQLMDKTHVNFELDYIQKGKGSFNGTDYSYHETKLNYIDLPITIHYTIQEKYTIQAGLSFAALLSYQFLHDGEINEAPTYTPNNFDFDYIIGGTYIINPQLTLSLRLAQSIIVMGDQIPEEIYRPQWWKNPGGMYNRSLNLALIYNIAL